MQVIIRTAIHTDSEEHIEIFKIYFDINELQYCLIMYVPLEEMLQGYTISRDSINDLTATGSRKILYFYFYNNDTIESIKEHIENALRNANYLHDEENYHYVAQYLSEELKNTIAFITGRNKDSRSLELLP